MNGTQERQRQDRSALEAELKTVGAEIRGNAVRCPFHDDKHASGSIYEKDGVWRYKCQVPTCGAGGDIFDIRGLIQKRPVADILREAGPDSRRPLTQTKDSRHYESMEALRLAVSRMNLGHIEAEYARGYADPDTREMTFDVFRLRTAEGKKRFLQAHCEGGRWFLTRPEGLLPLYERAKIRPADNIVVVEGEKCADALNALDIAATTSPMGAGKAKHADWRPLTGKRLWLWPDNDPDGTGRLHMKDVQIILDRLDPAPAIRVIEPNDLDLGPKEDAFDFIEQCRTAGIDPKAAVLEAMAGAKSFTPSAEVRSLTEDTISGKRADIPWPWRDLARLTQSQLPHCVTILCGSPGAAKSFMLLASLMSWFEQGIPIAHYALEKSRAYWLERIQALREHNVELLNMEWIKQNPEAARAANDRQAAFLDRIGKRISDSPAQARTLTEVAAWIRERAIEGARIISVDPVTATVASDKAYVSDTGFVNAVRAIVLAFDTSVLLVTHPRKGGGRLVGLDDLAGGAVYQRLSDTVLWIEKHAQPKSATVKGPCGRFETKINQTIHICKSRGPGHGLSVGFRIDWPTLDFAEQGIVVKKED